MLSPQHDQAAGLRQIMTDHQPKIISVLSAMQTQHQPRLISNLAASLNKQDSDVLVVQAGKVDLNHYGIKTLPALSDVAHKEVNIEQSVKSAKFGFLTAKLHSKQTQKTEPDDSADTALNKVFENLSSLFEVVLVDATLNKNHQLPLEILYQHEILIQLTCDAASIKQAYTLIKRIYSQIGRRSFGIIVSNATDEQAAVTFRNMSQVAKNYMQIDLEFFGAIPTDQHLNRAAKLGRTITDAFPLAKASKAFKALAQRLNYKHPHSIEAELASFV
ncbi:MAG: MotR [Methylophilaceae bacterium]